MSCLSHRSMSSKAEIFLLFCCDETQCSFWTDRTRMTTSEPHNCRGIPPESTRNPAYFRNMTTVMAKIVRNALFFDWSTRFLSPPPPPGPGRMRAKITDELQKDITRYPMAKTTKNGMVGKLGQVDATKPTIQQPNAANGGISDPDASLCFQTQVGDGLYDCQVVLHTGNSRPR